MTGNTTSTTPAQAFPIPVDGDDPDITGDLATLAKAIEKRVMGVYATTAARDSATAAAGVQAGMMAFVLADHKVYYYNGSAWVVYPTATPTITVSTSAPVGGADGDIWFKI